MKRGYREKNLILYKLIGIFVISLILAIIMYVLLQGSLPIVINQSVTKPNSNFTLLAEEVNNLLPAYAGLNSKEFCTNEPLSKRLEIVTEDGWRIILDSSKDAETQLEAVEKTLSQLSEEEKVRLEYIGVDTDGLIYYK